MNLELWPSLIYIDPFFSIGANIHSDNRYFNRDVNCIRNFFKKKFDFDGLSFPVLGEDTFRQYSLDSEIQASGFDKGMQEMFEKVCRIC